MIFIKELVVQLSSFALMYRYRLRLGLNQNSLGLLKAANNEQKNERCIQP